MSPFNLATRQCARHLRKLPPTTAITLNVSTAPHAQLAPSQHRLLRSYQSRAHPVPREAAPITAALESIVRECDERHAARLERWDKNKDDRVAQRAAYLAARGKPSAPTPARIKADAEAHEYRRMEETVELTLQLNLDPRKPGQSLRGSLSLPHGNGQNTNVAVFTDDVELAEACEARGAYVAGGQSLIESIQAGDTSLSSFQRALATPEMMPFLSSVARLLGPRGLMPTPKLNTILPKDQLLAGLEQQLFGMSNYRTDKDGIVRLGMGKDAFGSQKLLDNFRDFMNEIQRVKPEHFGKGKKGKGGSAKNTKYYLKAHLSSTQSKGSMLLDLRTLDPTSSFFMSDPQ